MHNKPDFRQQGRQPLQISNNLIYHIGKSTFSELGTGTAGNTAADIFISDMYDFRLNTIFCKDFFPFRAGAV